MASITFVDTQIGRVLDALDRSPMKNNTIVVFLGDHGYHLGEKEHWTKFTLWEEATKAPLAMFVPRLTKPGTVCDRTVDFLSLFPTLLDLCGIKIPKHVEGTSMKSLLKNPNKPWKTPVLSTFGWKNHAVRSELWRYIRYVDGGEELYDENSDPYEWNNLLSLATKNQFSKVKKDLQRYFPTINKKEIKARKNGTDTED